MRTRVPPSPAGTHHEVRLSLSDLEQCCCSDLNVHTHTSRYLAALIFDLPPPPRLYHICTDNPPPTYILDQPYT